MEIYLLVSNDHYIVRRKKRSRSMYGCNDRPSYNRLVNRLKVGEYADEVMFDSHLFSPHVCSVSSIRDGVMILSSTCTTIDGTYSYGAIVDYINRTSKRCIVMDDRSLNAVHSVMNTDRYYIVVNSSHRMMVSMKTDDSRYVQYDHIDIYGNTIGSGINCDRNICTDGRYVVGICSDKDNNDGGNRAFILDTYKIDDVGKINEITPVYWRREGREGEVYMDVSVSDRYVYIVSVCSVYCIHKIDTMCVSEYTIVGGEKGCLVSCDDMYVYMITNISISIHHRTRMNMIDRIDNCMESVINKRMCRTKKHNLVFLCVLTQSSVHIFTAYNRKINLLSSSKYASSSTSSGRRFTIWYNRHNDTICVYGEYNVRRVSHIEY